VDQRKQEHITLALQQAQIEQSPFDQFSFSHTALPEVDFCAIDTNYLFLGKHLSFPLVVASMTGGTELAKTINIRLARLCQQYSLALGVGSQRIALEKKECESSFKVRSFAPDIVLMGNLGAVQLNYGYTSKQLNDAISMIDADALFLHLNPLQEAIQPEGNANFVGLIQKIADCIPLTKKPLIIKEVGNGISKDVAQQLFAIGIRYIATEGRGGTNWALIEGERSKTTIGKTLQHWGIPTPESIRACSSISGLTVIGGGGIRNGLDAAKAFALGADLVSVGKPLLEAVMVSYEQAALFLDAFIKECKIVLFCTGCKTIRELREKGETLLH